MKKASLRPKLGDVTLKRWFSNLLGSGGPRGEPDAELFLSILKERDDGVYRDIFGAPYQGRIAAVSSELLEATLPSFDPSWTHAGVYVFQPSEAKPFWSYATAGLSTPWDLHVSGLPRKPEDVRSGFGIELLIRTPDFTDWAIGLLNRLIVHQLSRLADASTAAELAANQRIPLRGLRCVRPDSLIEGVILIAPADLPPSFVLRSGRVELLQLVGITREEYAWSIENGVELLVEQLALNRHLVTDLARLSSPVPSGASLPNELRQHFR